MNSTQIQKDLRAIFNDGNCKFSIISPTGERKTVSGFVGDIGYLLNTEGFPVAGRTVVASYVLSDLVDNSGKYKQPGRNWKIEYEDLSGKKWSLYVNRFEPDRTLGVGRLVLSLEMR